MAFMYGYLVKLISDVSFKTTQNGTSMANFAVANVEGTGKNKRSTIMQCVAWKGVAEKIANEYKKGDCGFFVLRYQNSPFLKNEKGYDIPNPQFVVEKINFLPPQKNHDDEEYPIDDNNSTIVCIGNEFAPIDGDTEDLPF